MKSLAQISLSLFLSVCVVLIQPGLSYFWLIDPAVHAAIDADEYGQTPDGQTLPGQPWRPPHEHPTSMSLGTFDLMQQNAFDAEFYATVFSPTIELSLHADRVEPAVIDQPINLPPPDHPPRA